MGARPPNAACEIMAPVNSRPGFFDKKKDASSWVVGGRPRFFASSPLALALMPSSASILGV